MKALWMENRVLSFQENLPDPVIAPDEALIRVRLAGICGTDLELLKGYYPYTGIPGHEFVGEVIEVGGQLSEWIGKRVVGEINLTCGECPTCLRGNVTHCERRRVLGIIEQPGVFASLATLPIKNLHQVPDSVPDESAVFCEPLAAAIEILEQVHLQPTDRVLVIGAGRLGQLIAQVIAKTDCEVQVVARHAIQRELLFRRGIACIDEDQVPARWADVVIEATGAPAGFYMARKAIRPRGRIVLKSTYKGEISVDFSSIVVDEITLVGSRCGPFPPALRALEKGWVDPRPLISATYPLDKGIQAFEQATRSGVLKVLLKP